MAFRIERDKNKIISSYNTFVHEQFIDESKLNNEFLSIRKFFLETYDKYSHLKGYDLDLNIALDFYEFINNLPGFASNVECDDDFWKNIAIFVIPDVIAKRHPNMNSDYYYSKNVRIYPYVLYWYIKLSWQGTREKTYNVLKNNSTDEIMQMVERPSTIGINVALYRTIMKKFSEIPAGSKRSIMINGKSKKIFRLVFIKNTAKLSVTRPEIYPGGIEKYVDMLFECYIEEE